MHARFTFERPTSDVTFTMHGSTRNTAHQIVGGVNLKVVCAALSTLRWEFIASH